MRVSKILYGGYKDGAVQGEYLLDLIGCSSDRVSGFCFMDGQHIVYAFVMQEAVSTCHRVETLHKLHVTPFV